MLRPGQVIALAVLALLTVGTVMVASAGMRVAPLGVHGYSTNGITLESILLSRNTMYAAASLVLLAAAGLLPVRSLSGWATNKANAVHAGQRGGLDVGLTGWSLSVIVMAGLLVMVYAPGLGRTVNGAARWVGVGGIGFQPSEVVKWGLIAALAWFAVMRGERLRSFWAGLVPVTVGAGLLIGLTAIEDLGTGVLMAAVVGAVLLAAGAKLWHLLLLVPPALAAVLALIVTSGYRARRILAFLDPYAYPETHGYHMIQSMIAIANGGGVGRGLGNGLQKFGYLPEDRTDFLFAVVCEELGLLGAVIVAGLYAMILLAGARIISRERDGLLALFGVGVLTTLGVQALMNMVVVTGLGPTKGIALPLLSAGGTGWMLTAACLGVLIAMDRTQPDEAVVHDSTSAAADHDDSDGEWEEEAWDGEDEWADEPTTALPAMA